MLLTPLLIKVLSAEFYFHKQITVHLELLCDPILENQPIAALLILRYGHVKSPQVYLAKN